MTQILADGQPLEIEGGFKCIVSEPGIRVEVPGFFEINARSTLKYVEELDGLEWEQIASSPLFPQLFKIVTDIPIPMTKAELMASDFGTQHLIGLIVLCIEYGYGNPKRGIKPQNIFLRTPEDMLHPRQTQRLMSLILKLFPHCNRTLPGGLEK